MAKKIKVSEYKVAAHTRNLKKKRKSVGEVLTKDSVKEAEENLL